MAVFEDTAAGGPAKQELQDTEHAVTRPAEQAVMQAAQKDREYDRRGVLLPRKARVGGIITPQ